MKKATTLAIFVTTGFYMAVGCIGYGGFGDDAPTNLLTGFGFFNPYWLIDVANVFIMVHLLGAYQVWDCFMNPISLVIAPACAVAQSSMLLEASSSVLGGLLLAQIADNSVHACTRRAPTLQFMA